MTQANPSDRGRWSFLASVVFIGLVSLVQPGCNWGSSDAFSPATIASVFPVQNSDTAPVNTNVVVFFGIDMNETTINDTTFTLTQTGGAPVTATVSYDPATRSATLDPDTDLISGTEYSATISSTIEDAAGNTPLASDFVWSFTISQATELVSKDIDAVVGNDLSENSAIDGTGRYIVFESEATNLVTVFTTFNRNHIYRKDTITGEVLLVSSDADGLEANNSSFTPRISDDGRFVVFASNATNLSSTISTGGILQVFIKDMEDGSVDLVSKNTGLIAANVIAANPDVSNDGRYIVFESSASNLTLLNNNSFSQIYRKDMSDESIEMISQNTSQSAGGSGNSNRPAMSPDARYIVFDSDAGNDIVSGATPGRHVYLVDMNSPDITEQVSVDSNEIQASGTSINASISDDGNYVAFESDAANLITGGTSRSDIYRRDRSAGETLLVSTPDGINSGDVGSFNASISANGAFVAFESASINLVVETTLGLTDIFVRDFSTAPTVTIQKINLSQSGDEATNISGNASISSDGRYVSYDSPFSYDITDTNTINDVYRSYNSAFQ
jgi:Tol biopolymer transport system component